MVAPQPPPLIAPPVSQQPFDWKNAPGGFPPRCLRCAYVLTGLRDGRCPECGRPFNLALPSTFTTKPPFIGWKFWLPGLLLAIGGGFAATVALLWMQNWGVALWFAVPFSGGAVLGYRVRSSILILVLLLLILIPGLIMGMMTLNLAGVFCGMALTGIFVGPVLVGTALGAGLRVLLKATNFSQRWHLPVWLLMLVPVIAGAIEGRPRTPQSKETVTTAVTMPADSGRAFDAIMFYEEVTHRPPLILRIGLAHPLFTTGSSQHVGDVKTCVYNKGHITKRITEVAAGKRLAFEVIDQQIGYERDVRLTSGSFEFETLPNGFTRVTLNTEYEPLLRPRWCWRPFEQYAMHTLHKHVLEGMRRRVAGEDTATTPDPAGRPLALSGGANAR